MTSSGACSKVARNALLAVTTLSSPSSTSCGSRTVSRTLWANSPASAAACGQLVELVLQPLLLGDVDEREHRALDHVVERAVRLHAHLVDAPVAVLDLRLHGGQRVEHRGHGADQVDVALEARGDVAERPSDVGRDEVHDLGDRGGEALDAQLLVDEQRADAGAGEHVVHVVVGARQLVDLLLQLAVDGDQLLVDRLQLLPGGLELLVGRLQLLVGGLHLLVGRLELLVGGLELLDGGAQVLLLGRSSRSRSAMRCSRVGRRAPRRSRCAASAAAGTSSKRTSSTPLTASGPAIGSMVRFTSDVSPLVCTRRRS